MTSSRRRRPHGRRLDVKDRLIQTRVPERLESVLKEEAQKRRLTVSHLIRNMLEDTFELVDTVVTGAGDLAKDSAILAEQVKHDAGKIALSVKEAVRARGRVASEPEEDVEPPSGNEPPEDVDSSSDESQGDEPESEDYPDSDAPLSGLDHVLAWNQVIANQPMECAGCGKSLARGAVAHLGLSRDPAAPPTWLCPSCLDRL